MDPCNWCGLPIRDGDSHGDQSVLENGAISIKCRTKAMINGEVWRGIYGRTVPMPNQKLYFSKLSDPNDW